MRRLQRRGQIMNSVKITYMILITIMELSLFTTALLAPIYLTPGWYFWSVFSLVLMLLCSYGASERMNSWADFG